MCGSPIHLLSQPSKLVFSIFPCLFLHPLKTNLDPPKGGLRLILAAQDYWCLISELDPPPPPIVPSPPPVGPGAFGEREKDYIDFAQKQAREDREHLKAMFDRTYRFAQVMAATITLFFIFAAAFATYFGVDSLRSMKTDLKDQNDRASRLLQETKTDALRAVERIREDSIEAGREEIRMRFREDKITAEIQFAARDVVGSRIGPEVDRIARDKLVPLERRIDEGFTRERLKERVRLEHHRPSYVILERMARSDASLIPFVLDTARRYGRVFRFADTGDLAEVKEPEKAADFENHLNASDPRMRLGAIRFALGPAGQDLKKVWTPKIAALVEMEVDLRVVAMAMAATTRLAGSSYGEVMGYETLDIDKFRLWWDGKRREFE